MRSLAHRMMLVLGISIVAAGPAVAGMVQQDEDGKKPARGWLGVSIQEVTERIAKKEKLSGEDGAYVNSVVEESPAEQAGIEERDVIVEFGGKSVTDVDDLRKYVSATAPGTKTAVVVMRRGERKTVQATVGKLKAPRAASFFHAMPRVPHVAPRIEVFSTSGMLGLRVRTLNEQLGAYFGAPNNEGVLVEEVEEKSAAHKGGFMAGDVIIRAGKRTVDDINDISRELRKPDEGDKLEFEVIRKGSKKNLTVEVDEGSGYGWFHHLPGGDGRVKIFRTPGGDGDGFDFEVELSEPMRMRKEAERMQRNLLERSGRLKVGMFPEI